ncbi:bifunctional diaminohydroxyphosphoribosylaminopyrimidine deaminase/5-amino-6-(5-phosphoribosylamino)uracil reductase RibD [Geobacter sp. DSM 9736]|uniref:bifunctional diaminohydroxyphosphoribosylaminopyrimidine deaminase/5-amino-6-(5-phosphoribosylamino)uracil reductase RibD n=1 Tax=Geobacter sp. DSM 9736 TaxID=1277350 RepID=UPI000B513C0D|nr:bifunctional diaminohydroxyphosphoribosylaminopyrimidine deaminase/5-amino-6-(5-phosphoribosylamino)uracil reductase RibD [Geobacter sp. DSM 9736]
MGEAAAHTEMMMRAVSLARKGIGKTSPNPAVGCVIVRDGVIVGEGWHRKAGTPHAEVHALRQAGEHAAGSDVYVTLEPCAHHGRTPPCANALVAARVGRVYVGMIDPNPLVSGKGAAIIRGAGIPVEIGTCKEECRRINEAFIKHVTTGLPLVVLKSAMSLDGKTATMSGDSKWITGEKSRAYVHRLRGVLDAVMVGAGTVIADDPLLTCRTGGRNPLRIIVDSNLRTPLNSQLVLTAQSVPTIMATVAGYAEAAPFRAARIEVLQCRAREGRVDLHDLFRRLGEMGIQSVLLEGGGTLAGEAFRLQLIDKFLLFYAPILLGGAGAGPFAGAGPEMISGALRLRDVTVRRFGDDLLVEGYPEGKCLRV